MGFFDKGKMFAEKAGEKIGKAADSAKSTAKLTIEKQKLKNQISSENSSINKTYSELGKKYYEQSGMNPAPEYESYVNSIRDSFERIEDLKLQIQALENDNTCPQCGAPMKKDQQFCQACGSRQDGLSDVPDDSIEVAAEIKDAADNNNNF